MKMSASPGPTGAEVLYDEVDAAVGKTEVVHDGRDLARLDGLADGLLHLIAQNGRLLDARARGCAQMQLELPGIDAREEILAQAGQRADRKREQRGRGHREQEDAGEAHAAVDRECQQLPVAVAHALEAVLEAFLEARQSPDLLWRVSSSFFFSQNLARVGMRVRDRI